MSTLTAYGPDAWLLTYPATPDTIATRQALWLAAVADPPAGMIACVPGYASLLFEFAPGRGDKAALRRWLIAHPATAVPLEGVLHTIPVRYDGLDLTRVATHTQMTVAEVIKRHCAPEYRVDLIGFAPGFPYLGGLDRQLATPRLNKPRVHVAAGSVAIGGTNTGIYPVSGPGGWNLIGHTETVLFDPASARCLLAPGDRVRFVIR